MMQKIKAKILKCCGRTYYDEDYGTNSLDIDAITDWEEVTKSELYLLQDWAKKKGMNHNRYSEYDERYIVVSQEDCVKEAMSEILAQIKTEEQKKKEKEKKRQVAAKKREATRKVNSLKKKKEKLEELKKELGES